MNEDKERLLAVVREYYGRVTWTHKTHEKDRELNSKRTKRDKWINVGLMALTTTGVLASIPLGSVWVTVTAVLLAFISTGFAIYQVSFSPETNTYEHRHAAKSLLIERDNLVLLIEKLMSSDANIPEMRRQVEIVVDRVGQIYSAAPDTSSKAYQLAGNALKLNDEFTFSPTEIDCLLPSRLRLEETKE